MHEKEQERKIGIEGQEDRTVKTPDYEWDITINCDQGTNNVIKLIRGGSVCIRGAKELFRDLMMAETYKDKIEALEKEQYNLEGERRYHLETIESLEKTRLKLDKLILQQLEIIRRYEEMSDIGKNQGGLNEQRKNSKDS